MKILITYPFGLGGVCQTELRQLRFSPMRKGYALMLQNVQREDVYRINLWSRIANKVFVVLAEQKVMDFDALFDLVGSLDWKQYIGLGHGVRVLAHSRDSQLASTRTIQSIVHKSILTQLTGSREKHWETDDSKSVIEISVDIYKDMATIMINTSGVSLHERGYRTEQGDAPLKENIAAGLLLLAGWDKKSPLYDPFCGSGTICIEAAMMVAGIAPGSLRTFAFEDFVSFDGLVWDGLRQSATLKRPGSFASAQDDIRIFGSDIDVSVLEKAQANASRAGVEDMVDFQEKHFLDQSFEFRGQSLDKKIWCVTNPPYGVRIKPQDTSYKLQDDLSVDGNSHELVEDLVSVFENSDLFGGFLLLRGLQTPGFSCIDLLNGQQEVCFYKK